MAVLNLCVVGWFAMHQIIIQLLKHGDKCFHNNIKIDDTDLAQMMGRGWGNKITTTRATTETMDKLLEITRKAAKKFNVVSKLKKDWERVRFL